MFDNSGEHQLNAFKRLITVLITNAATITTDWPLSQLLTTEFRYRFNIVANRVSFVHDYLLPPLTSVNLIVMEL
jgi:hypothetical protein